MDINLPYQQQRLSQEEHHPPDTYRHVNKDLDIPPDEYPDWYKEGHYDLTIIYADEDEEKAYALERLIKRLVPHMPDGKPPKVVMGIYKMHANSQLEELDILLQKSTHYFLLISDAFITNALCKLKKDEIIMECINDIDRRYKVVPVILQELTQKLPFGLKSLVPMQFKKKPLSWSDSTSHVLDGITLGNIDKYDRRCLSQLEGKLLTDFPQRRKREEEDKFKLEEWLESQKISRKQSKTGASRPDQEKLPSPQKDPAPPPQQTVYNITANIVQIGDRNVANAVGSPTVEDVAADEEYEFVDEADGDRVNYSRHYSVDETTARRDICQETGLDKLAHPVIDAIHPNMSVKAKACRDKPIQENVAKCVPEEKELHEMFPEVMPTKLMNPVESPPVQTKDAPDLHTLRMPPQADIMWTDSADCESTHPLAAINRAGIAISCQTVTGTRMKDWVGNLTKNEPKKLYMAAMPACWGSQSLCVKASRMYSVAHLRLLQGYHRGARKIWYHMKP